MDGVYDNPDRAINAWYGYHNPRMKHLQDFNEFRAQFARLAYIAGISRNQSKFDIRNKLYDGLRLGMETKVSKESTTFEVYCERPSSWLEALSRTPTRSVLERHSKADSEEAVRLIFLSSLLHSERPRTISSQRKTEFILKSC
jgi:hypothetical protein